TRSRTRSMFATSATRRVAIRVAAWPLALCVFAACGSGTEKAPRTRATSSGSEDRRIVVYNAGSLALPLRTVLDSFAAREHVTVEQENAGSLETARKLTELGKIPDIVAVADYEVIPLLLIPSQATWYAKFAHNRMVLAYEDRSRGAAEITTNNWWQVVTRPGVQVGRSDPSLDPNGYRTLIVWQLAERFYKQPGLAQKLLATAPPRNVRPKEADLVGLLQAGEFDYIWSYESIAQGVGARYVTLPTEIDLSASADSAAYAVASVRVAGKTPRDSVTMRGQPIVYAFTVPTRAPHPAIAAKFAEYLASEDGKRVMRGAKLDVLDQFEMVGPGAPTIGTRD
ncbi:MAG TPA: extracellular solute-binding protein, partial [Gemmatimonadaceae bacterium]|nr:extracellular solute-binding protein [Gemmatimonadaceae bacterium]